MSIRNVMAYLVDDAASDSHPKALAAVFDRLIWSLNDNGAEISRVRDEWLLGDDERRVTVALEMREVFPFDGGDRMRAEFARIGGRWPHLRPQVNAILEDLEMTDAARR